MLFIRLVLCDSFLEEGYCFNFLALSIGRILSGVDVVRMGGGYTGCLNWSSCVYVAL